MRGDDEDGVNDCKETYAGNRADETAKDDLNEETDGAEQNDTQAAQPAPCHPAPKPTWDQVADSDGGDDSSAESDPTDDGLSAESDPDDND